MTVLVGVDAGGSHTRAVCADESLVPRGRFTGPGGAVRADTVKQQAEVIATVVRGALREAGFDRMDAVVVGAAGAGREETRVGLEQALAATLGPGVTVHVTTDAHVALEAAFPSGAGIVLIAGSGSIALARDANGRVRRVGGLGWQFGDDGSGYALGRAALALVARAADGRAPATGLTNRLASTVGARSVEDIAGWAQAARPRDVAALAQAVCEEADAGDEQAAALVRRAAHDLLSHVAVLAERSGENQVKVAMVGGLLHRYSAVRRYLIELLQNDLPATKIVENEIDPVMGALAIAARLDA